MSDKLTFSRERAAGYDPSRMGRGRVLMLGAGAGASSLALALALSAVGEVLVVDFDEYEDHNATRSPFYPTAQEVAALGRGKARILSAKMAQLAAQIPGVSR